MPARKVEVRAEIPPELADGLRSVAETLEVPQAFPDDVQAAAEQAAPQPRLPDTDRTDLELVTIDPPGARDLDQALHVARDGDGFVVSYAIADVAAFVAPGDPVDLEAHRRGQTLYAPHQRIPLHPTALSEDGASLLADQVRPALLWTLRVDAAGELVEGTVARAVVKSRAQLTYEDVQQQIDDGAAAEPLLLLKEVGLLREQQERDRGGVSLNIPEQEVVTEGDRWELTYRDPLPVEGWNAQISLLTGIAAARIMLEGKVGVLRTLPAADEGALRQLRRTAKALQIAWPDQVDYPEFVRSLDPGRPDHAAMVNACTRLFRGAGYAAFSSSVPEHTEHAALAIDYAHCTAPLRRLVDRYAGEICLALCAGEPVPEWVLSALDALPEEMAMSGRLAGQFERGIVDLVEAFLLRDRVGETFEGTVIDVDDKGGSGRLMVRDPAVEGKITGKGLPLGEDVSARLVSAVLNEKGIAFELA